MKYSTLFFSQNGKIKDALKKVGQTGEKCLIIVDSDNLLLGTLSDGDIRRAILKGKTIDDSIIDIYQSEPTVLVEGKYNIEKLKKMCYVLITR